MIIKMKRDYAISYKYAWLIKGNIYDSEKLPAEVKAKVPDLVKRGIAIKIEDKSIKGNGVSENYRVKQLEQKKIEAEQEKADSENRQEQAQESVVAKPVAPKKSKAKKAALIAEEVAEEAVVAEEIAEEAFGAVIVEEEKGE